MPDFNRISGIYVKAKYMTILILFMKFLLCGIETKCCDMNTTKTLLEKKKLCIRSSTVTHKTFLTKRLWLSLALHCPKLPKQLLPGSNVLIG